MEIDGKVHSRIQRLLSHLGPVSSENDYMCSPGEVAARSRLPPRMIGFPRTTAVAKMFSAVTEKIYNYLQVVKPESDLVDLPKGDPPPLEKIYGKNGLQPGHVCVVGPTGSGKSTIVRGILVQLAAQRPMSIYTLEFPVEVSLGTHGLFDVCQIDMLHTINGKQRTLAETANALLKHDPDLIYFGELRTKTDFETATSISLSGVSVISTGHAHSPLDLLQRMQSMNIDLQTQFRAFRTIIGVKRVPILCNKCKRSVLLTSATASRAMRLLSVYRAAALSSAERRKERPIVCMPPPPGTVKCTCNGGYTHNHTIYEFLHIEPDDDLESLKRRHTHTTEETLIPLILQGSVNPLYLENFL
uniref:General secretion pathway protein E n=1 Tax=Malawimonas jakobiformis TaxID=136089 RepID=A0A895KR46_MALJA|nr:general secretion pathway protein E [Malawimonas jakobiformis]